MILKSLCCVWTLLLLLQHALCFSLEKHCARRCLYGRGGILCKCNAIHFTGKRSYDPKHSYTNPQFNHGNRHGFLLSIINRPEFLKSLAAASLSEQEDREETGNTKSIQLDENDEGNSDGLEKDDNVLNVGGAPLQTEVFFDSDKLFGSLGDQKQKSTLHQYNGLTRELAHLVKNAWQHLAPGTNIDMPADSFSSTQIGPTAEVFDTQHDKLLPEDESEEDSDLLGNSQSKINAKLSIVHALEELIKRLPTLIHRYESDSDSDLNLVGTYADDMQNLVQSREELNDVKEKNMIAWNRLMKYLSHTLRLKERHRRKRDEPEGQSDAELAKSN